MDEKKKIKICFAASSGGHYEQLMMLKPLMKKYDSFVITEKTDYSAESKGEKTYYMKQVNRREKDFIWRIAVNNSFDSMKLNNGTPGIEVAVSNLVNNMYSRDIAKKVRAALETNWKNGKATCTNVPFGYVWNKKGGQRWEIDPEAAASVKKVFELALSGRNTTQIAYGMNELNLPTPGLYFIPQECVY